VGKLSILIPVYNEGNNIGLILDKIKSVSLIAGIRKEIIIINDRSTDNSHDVISKYIRNNPTMNIHYYQHEVN